ncbi:predicted protein [Histoplasma mississippiense (nom. inval.)]|uniref:predicted protein n=1 Tax=Ajellomyces capsulatus (strain NAm1 / WU24) TaxID=2059318 RepID=UPI000157C402|nr:predicted protein [Histoplasma mississippiense (nom. inval.)]EDN07960.1 predicted protein [Histoplasma mississippiense (nom. inval.)]
MRLRAEYSSPPLDGVDKLAKVDTSPISTTLSTEELTPEEEKKLVWKIDRVVLPTLMLGFMVLQLDRANIGNALTDYFFRDVGITQNQFNTGQLVLPLAIILVEIPCNMILFRLGPAIWIGIQIFAWGTVATLQAFQKGLAAFLITRILLGICEAGFVPASLYTLTTWYKQNETSKRFAIFYIGNLSAGATSGLIAYGMLAMALYPPVYVFGAYAPTLVASFGFERLVSNALVTIGLWAQLGGVVMSFLRAHYAVGDLLILVRSLNGHLRFALLTLAIAFCAVWQPVNASWMTMNSRSPEERSIALAMFTMATNLAGIVSSHVFQENDRPLYVVGWNVNICLISAHVAIVIGTILRYMMLNRKYKRGGRSGESYTY